MNTSERRDDIVKHIKEAKEPIPAKFFATKYQVSRQVIVQDMAVIRASMPNIISTNKGYIIERSNIVSREFKVQHDDDRTEEELNIFVDHGGIVRNVSISHRVYGRISAQLDIRSRMDVKEYVERIQNSSSALLSSATSGYHYHVVEAASEERLDLMEECLKKTGFLVPLLPWEQENKNEE